MAILANQDGIWKMWQTSLDHMIIEALCTDLCDVWTKSANVLKGSVVLSSFSGREAGHWARMGDQCRWVQLQYLWVEPSNADILYRAFWILNFYGIPYISWISQYYSITQDHSKQGLVQQGLVYLDHDWRKKPSEPAKNKTKTIDRLIHN